MDINCGHGLGILIIYIKKLCGDKDFERRMGRAEKIEMYESFGVVK